MIIFQSISIYSIEGIGLSPSGWGLWVSLATALMLGVGFLKVQTPSLNGISRLRLNKKNEDRKLQFAMLAKIENPNWFRIKVLSYDLEVFINGSKVGKAECEDDHVLRAHKENEVPFAVETGVKGIFKGIGGLIGGLHDGEEGVEVRVVGEIVARGLLITKRFPLDVTERVSLGDL